MASGSNIKKGKKAGTGKNSPAKQRRLKQGGNIKGGAVVNQLPF